MKHISTLFIFLGISLATVAAEARTQTYTRNFAYPSRARNEVHLRAIGQCYRQPQGTVIYSGWPIFNSIQEIGVSGKRIRYSVVCTADRN